MKIETVEVAGIYPAIRGMRNPMNSWDKSDTIRYPASLTDPYRAVQGFTCIIGEADMTLARNLIRAGREHAKFLRQIRVWAEWTAPRYLWQEADTYKFGTKNSCSTMHKLHAAQFEVNDFYLGENPSSKDINSMQLIVDMLNDMREEYLETKEKRVFKSLKRFLPESYLQMRTWDTNYAELLNMRLQRKNHRLQEEWGMFCDWCDTLPYFTEFLEAAQEDTSNQITVRCRECVHYKQFRQDLESKHCVKLNIFSPEDAYCFIGERK